jgi:hypothetical protein
MVNSHDSAGFHLFYPPQAALLLASLALVPERLSSAVGSELRNSLVGVAQRWKVPAETISKPW